jgi:hypothetical protein
MACLLDAFLKLQTEKDSQPADINDRRPLGGSWELRGQAAAYLRSLFASANSKRMIPR